MRQTELEKVTTFAVVLGSVYFGVVILFTVHQLFAPTSLGLPGLGQFGDSMAPLTTLLATFAAVMTWRTFTAERTKDMRERVDDAFFRMMDLYEAAIDRYEDEIIQSRATPPKGSATDEEFQQLLDHFARGDAGPNDEDSFEVVGAWALANDNRPRRFARSVCILLEWLDIEQRQCGQDIEHHLEMFWGTRSRREFNALRRIVEALGSDRTVRAARRLGLLEGTSMP